MADGTPWFRRKRFGWGYTPVAWQGWAITIAFLGVAVGLDAALRQRHRPLEIAIFVIMTIGLVAIAAQHSGDADDARH